LQQPTGIESCAMRSAKHPNMRRLKGKWFKGAIDLVSLQQKYVLNEQADSKLKMYNFNDYLNTLLWTQRFRKVDQWLNSDTMQPQEVFNNWLPVIQQS
jgi:hypothetical protein